MTSITEDQPTSDLLRSGAYLRYRIAAYTVGGVLAFMTVVGLPWKYILGNDEALWYAIGWQLHGLLFMIYLVTVLDLAVKARWTPWRAAVIGIAGTVPFLSFVFERRVTAELRGGTAGGWATGDGRPPESKSHGSKSPGSESTGSESHEAALYALDHDE